MHGPLGGGGGGYPATGVVFGFQILSGKGKTIRKVVGRGEGGKLKNIYIHARENSRNACITNGGKNRHENSYLLEWPSPK